MNHETTHIRDHDTTSKSKPKNNNFVGFISLYTCHLTHCYSMWDSNSLGILRIFPSSMNSFHIGTLFLNQQLWLTCTTVLPQRDTLTWNPFQKDIWYKESSNLGFFTQLLKKKLLEITSIILRRKRGGPSKNQREEYNS